MSNGTNDDIQSQGATTVRLTTPARRIKPDTEKIRIWAEVWHKVIDKLLNQAFFAFLLVSFVVIAGFLYATNLKDFKDAIEVLKLLLPVVTLYLGFAIGQGMGRGD